MAHCIHISTLDPVKYVPHSTSLQKPVIPPWRRHLQNDLHSGTILVRIVWRDYTSWRSLGDYGHINFLSNSSSFHYQSLTPTHKPISYYGYVSRCLYGWTCRYGRRMRRYAQQQERGTYSTSSHWARPIAMPRMGTNELIQASQSI